MKEDNDILNRIDHRDGMTVPEGYFAEFAQRMAASLPVTEFEESEKEKLRHRPRSLWQTIRPYVYMAAMFAGVWCMMKMFTAITTPSEGFASSPTLAEAMDNEIFVNDYIIDDVDQWEARGPDDGRRSGPQRAERLPARKCIHHRRLPIHAGSRHRV